MKLSWPFSFFIFQFCEKMNDPNLHALLLFPFIMLLLFILKETLLDFAVSNFSRRNAPLKIKFVCFCPYNKKKITRWLEDMNFIFSCWKQYFSNI